MVEQKEGKRRFFGRPWVILLLIAVAFWLGNAVGSGSLQFGAPSNQAAAGLPPDLNYQSVEELYDTLRNNYDGKLTQQQVLDGLKKGLAQSTGDPYTEYFTASKSKEFNEQLSGEFSGIGAELGRDKDENIIIVSPIAGFPAEKAGIKSQDVIVTINGDSASGLAIDEAVSKIRGPKGTEVKLEVVRDRSQPLSFTITRDTIRIESVKTEVSEDNIGYIRISTFGTDTADLMTRAAQEMKNKNVKGIVLDLRGNPGGLLDASVKVSGLWLPSGKTILQEKRGGKVVVETYTSDGPGTLAGVPTVVLLDEGSASASEITAGALRDNGAARIMGVKSYGKGVVQQTICVNGARTASGCSADMLKVTVASWYTPKGQNINKQGIKPDQEVKVNEEAAKAGQDNQRQAAIDYLKSKQ